MYCTKASTDRIEKRGHTNGICSVCSSQIEIESTGRSIWFDGMPGGGGEVRQVGELHCPKCDKKPELPQYGKPIYESEIIKVSTK